jgi:hypothetical protein
LEQPVPGSRFLAMHRIAQGAGAGALILAITTAASAQPQPSVPDNKRGCSPPGHSENLSDKLAQSGGVICPQNTDPAIKAPTPPTGDKPVIAPPAGGSGNPNFQPK